MTAVARGYPGSRRNTGTRIPGQSGGYRPGFPANDPRPPSKGAGFSRPAKRPVQFGRRMNGPKKMVPGWAGGLRTGLRRIPLIAVATGLFGAYQYYRSPQDQSGYAIPDDWLICGTGGGDILLSGQNCGGIGSESGWRWENSGEGPGPFEIATWTRTHSGFGFHKGIINGVAQNPNPDTGNAPPELSPTPAVIVPSPLGLPAPYTHPWIDPFSNPINEPVPSPAPRRNPGRDSDTQRNPNRSPQEQTQRGLGRWPTGKPYQRPSEVPAAVTVVKPGQVVRTVPGKHHQAPPPRDTKEKKAVAQMGRTLSRVLSAATEAGDYIDAAYEALPFHLRRWKGRDGKWRDRHITPQDKLRHVYEHFDEMSVEKFAQNMVENELEDRFFGKIGDLNKRSIQSNPYYKSPVGWQYGPAF
jgi:hypothetical protein